MISLIFTSCYVDTGRALARWASIGLKADLKNKQTNKQKHNNLSWSSSKLQGKWAPLITGVSIRASSENRLNENRIKTVTPFCYHGHVTVVPFVYAMQFSQHSLEIITNESY